MKGYKRVWESGAPGKAERCGIVQLGEGFWGSHHCMEIPAGRVERRWSPAVPSNGTIGNGTGWEHRRCPLKIKNLFVLWEWPNTGTGSPGILSLCPWRYSKAVWTWSWAIGPWWPCLGREVELDNLHRSCPTSTVLQVCKRFNVCRTVIFVMLFL